MRDSEPAASGSLKHDTSVALRQVLADYSDPSARQDLQNQPLDRLMHMADRYARDSIRKEYPHLYGGSGMHADEALAHTTAIDDKLKYVARYAHHQWRGYGGDPEPFDLQQATLLVRVKTAVEKTAEQSGKPNLLDRGFNRLHAAQPDVFNEAYRALGLEPPRLQGSENKPATAKTKTAAAASKNPGVAFGPESPFG
jgi:hypothetical protein